MLHRIILVVHELHQLGLHEAFIIHVCVMNGIRFAFFDSFRCCFIINLAFVALFHCRDSVLDGCGDRAVARFTVSRRKTYYLPLE